MLTERLKQARKQKGFTQDELAKRLGTQKSTISNYETGYSKPSNEMLAALADMLDVSTDFLLGRISSSLERASEYATDDQLPAEMHVFFKDFKEAPKKRQEEMLRFWRFISEQEKDRSPGDRQD